MSSMHLLARGDWDLNPCVTAGCIDELRLEPRSVVLSRQWIAAIGSQLLAAIGSQLIELQ